MRGVSGRSLAWVVDEDVETECVRDGREEREGRESIGLKGSGLVTVLGVGEGFLGSMALTK